MVQKCWSPKKYPYKRHRRKKTLKMDTPTILPRTHKGPATSKGAAWLNSSLLDTKGKSVSYPLMHFVWSQRIYPLSVSWRWIVQRAFLFKCKCTGWAAGNIPQRMEKPNRPKLVELLRPCTASTFMTTLAVTIPEKDVRKSQKAPEKGPNLPGESLAR